MGLLIPVLRPPRGSQWKTSENYDERGRDRFFRCENRKCDWKRYLPDSKQSTRKDQPPYSPNGPPCPTFVVDLRARPPAPSQRAIALPAWWRFTPNNSPKKLFWFHVGGSSCCATSYPTRKLTPAARTAAS